MADATKERKKTMEKSKGHLFYAKGSNCIFEYIDYDGDIYRAKADYPIDVSGYRMGLRFEYPAHMADKIRDIVGRTGMEIC